MNTTAKHGPSGALRSLFRAPVWIYRLGLGGVLGHRLVLLTHIGRVSGRPRQTVLEVVDHGRTTGVVLIASGYGSRSQWLRNIVAHPTVRYQLGWKRFEGTATLLPPEESGRLLARYARRHPRAAASLMRLIGHTVRGEADYRALGSDPENGIPLVALRPAGHRAHGCAQD